jgi:aldehyde dehydrogenase (NAD+)
MNIENSLKKLGLSSHNIGTSTGSNYFSNGDSISSYSPVDGKEIGTVSTTTHEDYNKVIESAQSAFKYWRTLPAPQRGEIVRQFGNKLRELKDPLGVLVSYEMGKSFQEGLGEVQEMIDICDFAVGLSRQLHGLTMHSERPGHRMYEQYHPLGIVGIISAFNFPVAVWSWNTALAWICGDVCVWKPSEKTPLCSVACQKIIADILKENDLPEGISCLINGDYKVGEYMTKDKRIPLISATGSTRMGKIVASEVGARLGKSLLELGGNNAIIVTPDADVKMTVMGAVFGAVGTAGQRCTSTRRLIIHEDIYNEVRDAVVNAYKQIKIGNPLDQSNHVGPVIDKLAVDMYSKALDKVVEEGGNIIVEGGILEGEGYESGCYVKPAIAEAKPDFHIVQEETFAPILYLLKYSGPVTNAIEIQNNVTQGLSSAIMTNNLKEAEKFLSSRIHCFIARF